MLLWQVEFLSGARELGADVTLVRKKDSLMMRFLEKALFFCPEFSKFTTTIHRTIYTPSIEALRFEVLAHEMRHVLDWQRWKIWYTFLYTWPQNFALLSLLSWFSWWWMLCLLFLLPLPAPGRMWLERRAYLVMLLVWRWKRGETKDEDLIARFRQERREINWAVGNFTGPAYYWMWPFKRSLEDWFFKNAAKGEVPTEEWMVWLKEMAEKYRRVSW